MTATPKIVTIGVYGFDEAHFFAALQKAHVDTLCDVRKRRDVRGSEYTFANSLRLQARLAELGIRYIHRIDLAPSDAGRQAQYGADKAARIPTRKRTQLCPAFIEAYKRERLAQFDPQSLLDETPKDAKVIALFCVEGVPTACHRSLLAKKLATYLKTEVTNIVP